MSSLRGTLLPVRRAPRARETWQISGIEDALPAFGLEAALHPLAPVRRPWGPPSVGTDGDGLRPGELLAPGGGERRSGERPASGGDGLRSGERPASGGGERPAAETSGRVLAEAAKAGDADAWEALYRAVYPRLRAYVSRRVGPEAADDLVNETMARAVVAIGRFQWGPAGFDGWVFGIARRVTAGHLRRAERERRAMGRARIDISGPVPGEAIEQAEDAKLLRQRFAQLSPGEREVLELRVVAGLSAEQAATALGKRAGAVRMAQSRALANLRRLMEQP